MAQAVHLTSTRLTRYISPINPSHLSSAPACCFSLLFLVILTGCTSGAEQRQESRATVWRPLATWSGSGTTTLETFPIGAGRLRIFWDARSKSDTLGRFHVRLHSADSGRVLDDVVDMNGPGAGSREIVDDHQRFYLSVEASALDWTVRVEEGLATRR
jgi:hypothetical protein